MSHEGAPAVAAFDIELATNIPEIDDKPKDECGVFGVYAPGEPVAGITYQALLGLQHRGQSGAGIAYPEGKYIDGRTIIRPIKNLGLVAEAIGREVRPHYRGLSSQLDVSTAPDLAIGHTRYCTAESNDVNATQPLIGKETNIALAHNGHIDGLEIVAARYDIDVTATVSDSDMLTQIIDQRAAFHGDLEASLAEVLPQVNGAYSLVITDGERVIAARDPYGFHPLALGELSADRGIMVASEAVVFKDLGADFIRDVEPGEVVTIDEHGLTSFMIDRQETTQNCMFEYIYIARPDGTIDSVPVYRARKQLGRFLAEDNPDIAADVVVPVPQSGLAAAAGFAEVSGIPQVEGIFKNPYVGRSFIERGDKRQVLLNDKFRMNAEELRGKRVALVDDSIIKGKTMSTLISMLREAGATEVTVLSSAPPYINACLMGMDTHNTSLLIARDRTAEEVAEEIGADRVIFNTVRRAEQAIRESASDPRLRAALGTVCTACATGEYPFPVSGAIDVAMPRIRSKLFADANSGA